MILKALKRALQKRHIQSSSLVVAAVVMVIGAVSLGASHAAGTSGTLSMSPSSGTYNVGDTVTITVSEDSGSTNVNGVQANITYPASELEYKSYSIASSGFNYPGPAPTLSSGSFQYAILSETMLSGPQTVLTLTFQVLAPGTATVSFSSSSVVATSTGTNENAATTGATLTLQAGTTTPVTTTTPPPPVVTVPPSVTVSTTPQTTTAAPKPSTSKTPSHETSITPSGSTTAVPVTNGSTVKISAPASVQPTANTTSSSMPTNPIVRVQYYLNNKLISTQISSPYAYKLDTTKLLNGKYNFTTKTYYATGTSTSSTQKLDVANPESITQFKLAAQHYAGPSGLVILLLLIVILLFYGRNKIAYYYRERLMRPTPIAGPAVVINAPPTEQVPPTLDASLQAKAQSESLEAEINKIPTPVQAPPGTVYGPDPKEDQKP